MASTKGMWLDKFHISWLAPLWIQFCHNLLYVNIKNIGTLLYVTTSNTQTISHYNRQNSIHCCSSFYLLIRLKRHKSHLINILFIAQQSKENDQQQWSDKTMSLHTHGEQNHMAKPTEGARVRACTHTHTHTHKFYEICLLKHGFLVMASCR
jgi:hypothetical protein